MLWQLKRNTKEDLISTFRMRALFEPSIYSTVVLWGGLQRRKRFRRLPRVLFRKDETPAAERPRALLRRRAEVIAERTRRCR